MTSRNSFTNHIALKEKPHRRVYGLFLAPTIECGPNGYRAPLIHHSEFDYPALGELLGDLFWQGAPVQLRLPNDVIDVSTFDNRVLALKSRGVTFDSNDAFVDFGKSLMREAKAHNEGVIDIRKSRTWLGLKSKAALLEQVYPPQVVPLCVLSNRVSDLDLWYLHALEALDATPLPLVNLARAFSGKPEQTTPNQGMLPARVSERLSELFKVPFEPRAMIVPIAGHLR